MTALGLSKRVPVPPAFARAWDRMSARERRFAIAAAAVVLLAAAWGWLWQPLQEDSVRIRRELARDRAALATARAQAAELAGLQRGTQAPRGGDPRVAIERVLGERGMKSALTSLEVKDDRTTVTFAAIGFDALVGVLDALAKTDGLRPHEASLTARVDPGNVRAEVTLTR
jgi:type II secretory pathway component PulM